MVKIDLNKLQSFLFNYFYQQSNLNQILMPYLYKSLIMVKILIFKRL